MKFTPTRVRPRQTKAWRRVGLAVLGPVVLFALAEFGLRLAGFGHAPGFVLRATVGGREVWTDNPRYCETFHGEALARSPEPFAVPVRKAPGALRVVVLGSSAAMGDPYPSIGFARQLEVLLQRRQPGRHVEVINAAMTAVNSHVVRRVAHDGRRLQPDCFVVLTGNNEVIGPYGPGTVFSPALSNPWLIGLSIRARQLRLGQWVARWRRPARGAAELEDPWLGLELFLRRPVPADDPALPRVAGAFRRNLEDVARTGLRSGAGVALCTVPVNLKDCAPFGDAGGRAVAAYRRGATNLARGASADALRDFQRARDLDVYRFRADSALNAAVRAVAGGFPTQRVSLVDAEAAFRRASPDDVPGDELFVDHVHPTAFGHYLLAAEACRAVERLLGFDAAGAMPAAEECAAALAHTPWDEHRIAEILFARMTRAPFTAQCDHEARLRALAHRKEALKRAADAGRSGEWLAAVTRALERRPDDWVLHAKCGQRLQEAGQPAEAVAHFRAALALVPHAGQVRRDLAVALALAGSTDEAVAELRRSGSRLYRSRAAAVGALGAALLKEGQTDAACAALADALRDEPERLSLRNNCGLASLQAGRVAEAEAQFRRVLAAAPGYGPAHGNLGLCLVRQGRAREAYGELARAAELCPADADVQGNLGLVLLQAGRPQEALAPLRRAVALQPDSFAAHNNLGYALSVLDEPGAAAQSYREALVLGPGQPRVEINLADALLASGKAAEALEVGRQALAHATDDALAETIRGRIGVFEAAAPR